MASTKYYTRNPAKAFLAYIHSSCSSCPYRKGLYKTSFTSVKKKCLFNTVCLFVLKQSGVVDCTFQNHGLNSKSVLAFQSIGQSKGIVRDTNFSSHFFIFSCSIAPLATFFTRTIVFVPTPYTTLPLAVRYR